MIGGRVRVAGRDRLGYRRRGGMVGLAEQIGRAMRVPEWVVRPRHDRGAAKVAGRRRAAR